MANSFLTAANVAGVTAKLVGLDLKLAALLSRDVEAEFVGGRGSTVLVPVPGAVKAQVRPISDKTTALVSAEIAEQSIPVTLTDNVYSLVNLSHEDLELNLTDFARQVSSVQARGIAADIEARVLTALQAVPETTSITWDATAPAKTFTKIRARLRQNKVADDARLIAVAGTDVEAALLDGPDNTFDASGKVRGFEVHFSNRLAPTEIVGFVPEAFSLVVRAPEKPDGAPYAASIRTDGEPPFALLHIRQWNLSVAAEQSYVTAFVKVQAMPLPVLNEANGTVALVPNAGAVRVDVAA